VTFEKILVYTLAEFLVHFPTTRVMLNKVYTYGFILDIHAPLTSTQTDSAALRLNCGLFLEKSQRRTQNAGQKINMIQASADLRIW